MFGGDGQGCALVGAALGRGWVWRIGRPARAQLAQRLAGRPPRVLSLLPLWFTFSVKCRVK